LQKGRGQVGDNINLKQWFEMKGNQHLFANGCRNFRWIAMRQHTSQPTCPQ